MRLDDVRIKDPFWNEYIRLVREVVLPYQSDILHDRAPGVEPSYAIANFRVAAGEEAGGHRGMVFQDSDVAKWLEAVAYALHTRPDAALQAQADEVIDLIARAQMPDGYLNTFYQIGRIDERFTNLCDCHELYCLGHFIEAAVAYAAATGKRTLLQVVCRYTDLVCETMGPGEGQLHGYPGHQELELALVKLAEATGEEKYLRLAEYFLNERGKEPNFFVAEWEARGKTRHWGDSSAPRPAYHQAHKPVRRQTEAVGHAVRAVYMYTGMARVAAKTGDQSLLDACRRLWDNIQQKQLYITGGIGQTVHGEAFTFDYDLPNDTVYSETCAAIGLIFFARAMLEAEPNAKYADVMERALYNTVLAGMAKDGKHYFYVNPLEVWPEASEKAANRAHVKPRRPSWYGCACCPPNVARLLTSLGGYIYGQAGDTVFAHLYVGGTAGFDVAGQRVELDVQTQYPHEGDVDITFATPKGSPFTLALRLPDWCAAPRVAVNGEAVDTAAAKDGYLYLTGAWGSGDTIRLELDMPPVFVRANPQVRADAGRVALCRGPLVYCLEETDNAANLSALSVDVYGEVCQAYNPGLLGGAYVLTAAGWRDQAAGEALYYPATGAARAAAELTFVPYYLWGNRVPGEMAVWVRD